MDAGAKKDGENIRRGVKKLQRVLIFYGISNLKDALGQSDI